MSFGISLNKQKGTITISGAGATLTVPDNYYFLDAKDAEKVLVDVWGNPLLANIH